MIVLVQLSDIHFRSPDRFISGRLGALQGAIRSKFPTAECCFIILSGDIANAGSGAEYKVAAAFMSQLRAGLLASGFETVEIISVPGNHDLNLANEVDTRQTLLENPETYVKKGIDFKGLNYDAVISVQDEFFGFDAQLSGSQTPNEKRICYQRSYQVGERRILFHCFNTAWLSQRHEQQGKLFIPPSLLTETTPADVSLSIAVLHHPYNWMDSNNQRDVKNFVNSQADIALTGHEHEQDISRVTHLRGASVDYFAAPAFFDPNVHVNGFQMFAIDFDKASQDMFVFSWTGSRFSETGSGTWQLRRNSERAIDPLTIRDAYWDILDEVGTGFTHPRCTPPQCELKLGDLFVYPDLLHRQIDQAITGKGTPASNLHGTDLAKFVIEKQRVLIFGAEDSGKTSLSKVLFQDLSREGLLPVLMKGSELKGTLNTISRRLEERIVESYNGSSAEPYLQAEALWKVLIIDDFDHAKISQSGQSIVLTWLAERFPRIVIFASDIFEIQDLANTSHLDIFNGYERCTIKQFGSFHRHNLIEKWLRLGQDDPQMIELLDKRVSQTDKMLSTLLGKNVLPHHPVTILTLLQMLENKEPTNTSNGAYGYMYELLIKGALAKVDRTKVDEKITYISGIGYALFHSREPVLSDAEMRRVHNEYCERFDMTRDYSKMMEDLLRAEILVSTKSGYRFKYPYAFYYSAAKYFQDNAASLREELRLAADHIYGETNANVLIFYVYLTKDEELIREIVASAKKIFATIKPCDLDADVDFLNKLMKQKPPPLELECWDTKSHREEHNRKMDAAIEEEDRASYDRENTSYDERLQLLIKFSIAFKTLQLLGQVLRNFTGSLPWKLKLEIVEECYGLGMRTLGAILSIPLADLEGMRQYLGSLIAERTGITDTQKLADKTDQAIVWLGSASAFGAVKRISYAVGHSDLENTYGRVLQGNSNIATQVIDATIKLDHFERVDGVEHKRLATKLDKNFFTYRLMRDLVADYLYLYNNQDFSTQQMLGSTWGIAVSTPKYLTNRSKR